MTLVYYSASVIVNTEVEHTTLVSIFEIRYTRIGVNQTRFFNYHAVIIINKRYVQSYDSVDIFIEIIIYCPFTTNYVFQLTDAEPAFNTTITISENPSDYYQYAILRLICLLVFLWFGLGSVKDSAGEIYIRRRLVSYLKLYKKKKTCVRLCVFYLSLKINSRVKKNNVEKSTISLLYVYFSKRVRIAAGTSL